MLDNCDTQSDAFDTRSFRSVANSTRTSCAFFRAKFSFHTGQKVSHSSVTCFTLHGFVGELFELVAWHFRLDDDTIYHLDEKKLIVVHLQPTALEACLD